MRPDWPELVGILAVFGVSLTFCCFVGYSTRRFV